MQSNYIVRQQHDQTWSVLQNSTGTPLRLAGIPQTGLTRIEADLTLDMLNPKANRTSPQAPRDGSAYSLTRAMV